MKVNGAVVKEKGDFVFVRSARPESCAHCANSGLCSKKELEICAHNDIGAQIGDYVTVETNEDGNVIPVFAYLFLVPIAILFLGYFFSTVSPWLTLAALPLLAAYGYGLYYLNKNHPVRARVISPAIPPKECEPKTESEE